MSLFLLLQLAWLVLLSMWLEAHGEDLARALVTAFLSLLAVAVATLSLCAWAVVIVCRRRKRA